MYFENAKILERFIVNHKYVDWEKISVIEFPKDAAQEALLVENKVLVTAEPKYALKILYRGGVYSQETKSQISTYLINLPAEEAHLSISLTSKLTNGKNYLTSGYFYATDRSLIIFLTMISPNFVMKIHELIKPE